VRVAHEGHRQLSEIRAPDAAFERWYAREFAVVAHAAYAVGGDGAAATAIAQEAFAMAMASWPRVKAMDRPTAWVRRMAVALALKARTRGEGVDDDDAGTDAGGLARTVRRLPAQQRLAVVLHDVHDLSLAEVADTLSCPEATVEAHLARAHRVLAAGRSDDDAGLAGAVKTALQDEFRAVADTVPTDGDHGPAEWSRPTMVFVTSPALGPSSLTPTVEAVIERGHEAGIVDLSDLADQPEPRWRAAAGRIAAAVYATRGPVVLVGHGQAGPLVVPVLELRQVAGLILVDTALPPVTGEMPTLPVGLLERLADQVVDGRLPRWETWWPQCALEFLVDDPELRAAIRDELPSLPASFGAEEVPVGRRMRTVPTGFLRLSLVRETEATFAGMRGMAVERLAGDHLLTATEPEAVAAKLDVLMAALEPAMI
jgi:DNA-directed RNA polymerase specialized sigma24 family protein